MSGFIIIRHVETGVEKRVSTKTYELMTKGLKKQWQRVGNAQAAPTKGGGGMTAQSASFIPEEIREKVLTEAHDKEVKAATEMISGAPAQAAPKAPASPVAEAQPASPVNPAEQPEEAKPADQQEEQAASPVAEEKADDLASLPNMGAKCAEVLASAGIRTFAKLIDTPTPEINAVLEANNFGPKRAQVPQWKSKAKSMLTK